MGNFKHLLLAKFKEEAAMEEIKKGVEKMASEIDEIKSFEWGEDKESKYYLTQGFTHAFLLTFESTEEFTAYLSHPSHVQFGALFRKHVEKYLVLDFPSLPLKSPS